jgi:hypothetical protein
MPFLINGLPISHLVSRTSTISTTNVPPVLMGQTSFMDKTLLCKRCEITTCICNLFNFSPLISPFPYNTHQVCFSEEEWVHFSIIDNADMLTFNSVASDMPMKRHAFFYSHLILKPRQRIHILEINCHSGIMDGKFVESFFMFFLT